MTTSEKITHTMTSYVSSLDLSELKVEFNRSKSMSKHNLNVQKVINYLSDYGDEIIKIYSYKDLMYIDTQLANIFSDIELRARFSSPYIHEILPRLVPIEKKLSRIPDSISKHFDYWHIPIYVSTLFAYLLSFFTKESRFRISREFLLTEEGKELTRHYLLYGENFVQIESDPTLSLDKPTPRLITVEMAVPYPYRLVTFLPPLLEATVLARLREISRKTFLGWHFHNTTHEEVFKAAISLEGNQITFEEEEVPRGYFNRFYTPKFKYLWFSEYPGIPGIVDMENYQTKESARIFYYLFEEKMNKKMQKLGLK